MFIFLKRKTYQREILCCFGILSALSREQKLAPLSLS